MFRDRAEILIFVKQYLKANVGAKGWAKRFDKSAVINFLFFPFFFKAANYELHNLLVGPLRTGPI